jgi:peroxiredoxin
MDMKKLISVLLILTTATALFAKPATLKGKVINNTKYKEIHLQDLSFNNIETQSIDENGNFSFEKSFDKFNFYLIVLDQNQRIFTVFFPEPGEQTEMTIDIKNIQEPEIKNSVHTNLYYEYSSKLGKIKPDNEKIALVRKMIDENPNSPTCVFFVDILSPESHYAYHEKLSNGLKKYEHNEIVKEFITKTDNVKKLEVGNIAPDIDLKDPDGKSVKLSSLRGNYVLIDFWASWCGPCRMENPNVVKLYNKYHAKGFEIYGVSLDRSRDAWLKAIEKDKLTWVHVSDLKFWHSEGAKIYNVSAIPHTVLLDKEGRILAKDLRGSSLERKLEEIFGE